MPGKRVSKKKSIKQWKKGINNTKNISVSYPTGDRKGIRL